MYIIYFLRHFTSANSFMFERKKKADPAANATKEIFFNVLSMNSVWPVILICVPVLTGVTC